MQTRNRERAAGLHLAGDMRIVEGALGLQCDDGGLGIALVAIFERSLHGAQRSGIHGLFSVERPSLAQRLAASPPQSAAVSGLGLAVVGDDRTFERTIERREYTPLDEIECRRLAVARARQVAGDFLVHAARMRTHYHDAVGEHDRFLDVV